MAEQSLPQGDPKVTALARHLSRACAHMAQAARLMKELAAEAEAAAKPQPKREPTAEDLKRLDIWRFVNSNPGHQFAAVGALFYRAGSPEPGPLIDQMIRDGFLCADTDTRLYVALTRDVGDLIDAATGNEGGPL